MAVSRDPRGDVDSAAWWRSLEAGRLRLPQCHRCGRRWFPPAPTCPHCGAADNSLEDASGWGRIYSWVVVHRTFDAAFVREVPYVILAVDLDEGGRMFGRLVNETEGSQDLSARGALRGGADVRAVLYDSPGGTLVGFRLAAR